MINTVTTQKAKPEISTVEEKILLEKQLPFNPHNKKGPTVNLYFHELVKEKSWGQQTVQFLCSISLGICFVVTFPIIALLIKLFSQEAIFQKVTAPGQRGAEFQQYLYSESLLQNSWLKKLPSVINIWKGEMDLIGPHPYPAEWSNNLNNHLSDYYKRFALKPGYLGLTEPISDPNNLDAVASSLQKEFRYIVNPSLKKDLRHLFGSA